MLTSQKEFRDEQGNPTDNAGLRLHLHDFAHQELVQQEIGDYDQDVTISTRQLCEYLTAAEAKTRQTESLSHHVIAPGVKKRKRSETPPEQIVSGDEATYRALEERAAKRIAANDSDYEDTLSKKSSSE